MNATWTPGDQAQKSARNLDHTEVEALTDRVAESIRKRLGSGLDDCLLLGLETGGKHVARMLHRKLGLSTKLGSINVHFHRDDFGKKGVHPDIGASDIPESVDDRLIILVDDVLYTGRTVRAALNELFDYGRPDVIQLAVLIDRGGRELPVQADYVGETWTLPEGKKVVLTGTDKLQIQIEDAAQ